MRPNTPLLSAELLAIAGLLAIGCSQPDPIRTYQVDKDSERPPRVAMSKPTNTPPSGTGPPAASSDLAYDTPTGWKPAKKVMFAAVSLEATEGDETAKITVTPMGAAQAALVPNIRRWREQQLGLPPISAEEIENSAQDVQVGDATAKFFALVGPERGGRSETILGALLPQADRVLIVKLRAESKMASGQKDNFLNFLRSLKSK